MFDLLTILSITGFALVIVIGARLGAGSHDSLAGMLASQAMPDRPRGTQERDLPPFVFENGNGAA